MSITKTFRQQRMSKAALAALSQHFEEQYGKLDLKDGRGKKRRRTESDKETGKKKELETDREEKGEEWQGIQEDNTLQPEVVVFNDGIQESGVSAMKPSGFMVMDLRYC
jgi:hypothetical protein